MRVIRPIVRCGETATIELTKGFRAVIDAADIPLVEGRNWSALTCTRRNAVYACRGTMIAGKQKMILLHRLILGIGGDAQADHKDGDGLNNRRSNLRICSHAENQINKPIRKDNHSCLKGVSWDGRCERWKAEIQFRGDRKFLGYFATKEQAHAAYRVAATEIHGEFARLS